ncbi:MAG: putative thioredoxin [Hyphomonadaceae bacterium]|nr:MAG: putative thioredoxin [Hyphomonadaceae bacterium]KAF0187225.1 MAG: putative thioredoxin [Hyphomonadaceae bacterium]
MANSDLVKDITDAHFASDVIEASDTVPVLVDFWAPWCGPCRTLGPAIESVVQSYGGKVKLVKINIDQNPHYAGQLGVKSIPAVFAFKKGQAVDGFMGALPASQIKAFVDKLVGSGSDSGDGVEKILASAEESLSLDDIGGAAQSYAQVLQIDSANLKALVGLAHCYLKGDDIEKASELLAQIPADKASESEVVALRALISLSHDAQGAAEPKELLTILRGNQEDFQARFDLARAYIKHGDFEGAIEALFVIMNRDLDWNQKQARHLLLKIFDALGNNSEITKAGRRRLSSLLFS